MFKQKIYDRLKRLKQWKEESDGRTALLVEAATQMLAANGNELFYHWQSFALVSIFCFIRIVHLIF